jgi:hypothetical protein
MKALLVLIVIGVAGYLIWDRVQSGDGGDDRVAAAPAVIKDPVYAEYRMDVAQGGREINVLLLGEMIDMKDCQRDQNMWRNVVSDCPACKMPPTGECKTELDSRYSRLFENVPIHSTYMTFTRASPRERSGRMVIYGLTADEGDRFCEMLRGQFVSKYQGQIGCIKARRD